MAPPSSAKKRQFASALSGEDLEMRSIFAAAFIVASASLSHADDSSAVGLNASELRNVWRTCDVSGRARLAKVRCINEQAEKLVRGKAIEQTNVQSEELTRQQVGARRP